MSAVRADALAREWLGMSERVFQGEVVHLAKVLGWTFVYHTFDSRRSAPGFPDLVLVSPKQGRVLYRELKAAKGRVSPEQTDWLAGLTAAGQDAGIWRPADWLSGRIISELKSA